MGLTLTLLDPTGTESVNGNAVAKAKVERMVKVEGCNEDQNNMLATERSKYLKMRHLGQLIDSLV